VNGFLVGGERGPRVEHALAVFDAAAERHLARNAEQGAVLLALVSIQTAFVLESDTAVAVLTGEAGLRREINANRFHETEIERSTVAAGNGSCVLLKRTKTASQLTPHTATLYTRCSD